MPTMQPEVVEMLRRDYEKATTSAERDAIIKRFLFNSDTGRVRRYCNLRMIGLVQTSTRQLKALRAELDADGGVKEHERSHGMKAYRRDNEPANKTDPATVAAVKQHIEAFTYPLPEARNGKKVRKCFDPKADGIDGLAAHFQKVWQPQLADRGVREVKNVTYERLLHEYGLRGVVEVGLAVDW